MVLSPQITHGPLTVLSRCLLLLVLGGSASDAAAGWFSKHEVAPEDARAKELVAQMTTAEQLRLVMGDVGAPMEGHRQPDGALGSSGFVPGIERLGIPALQETDAELGVTNPPLSMRRNVRSNDVATALPANLAIASIWDTQAAYTAGALVGDEARRMGFNVLLGGSANLVREPRGGRDFEYYSEDPLLTGELAAAAVRGTQDQHVISTVKHFVFNDQESGRKLLDAQIDEPALRESDLLAFRIAIDKGQPGAVMCSYNRLNGAYACGNDWLLNQVLKTDWKFPGWVMSDWGAVHDPRDANAGLDQESGAFFDKKPYFGAPLAAAVEQGTVSPERLQNMAERIVRSMIAANVIDNPPKRSAINFQDHANTARELAEQGMVLLKNSDAVLPINPDQQRIVVIGGHADSGVPSGSGSSQVRSRNGYGLRKLPDDIDPDSAQAPWSAVNYLLPAPYSALQERLPKHQLRFVDGSDVNAAVDAASNADLVLMFAVDERGEGSDSDSLNLPDQQDALISAVAAANPRTVVVLETGGPVAMPWLDQVAGVLEAWYPGGEGARAIARVLAGDINPSGRLPVSFPASVESLPYPQLRTDNGNADRSFIADYNREGADIGYRWYQRSGQTPLFAFGFGLSYTQFEYSDFVFDDHGLLASVNVKNTGSRAGVAVLQLYGTPPGGGAQRLVGWTRAEIKPGETHSVSISLDTLPLSRWDEKAHAYVLDAGQYTVQLGTSATTPIGEASFKSKRETLGT